MFGLAPCPATHQRISLRAVLALGLLLAGWSSAAPAHSSPPLLALWHYGTLPLGTQRCEASFMFDAGRSTFREVRVQAVAKDRQGQHLARFTLTPDDMGVEGHNRFASASWISPHACDPKVVIAVRRATAQIDGMATDLLATEQLQLRRYEPLELRLPKSRERP